ncbi:MAG: hypothetical protein Q9171_004571 [Xanthocarpia ochracea]
MALLTNIWNGRIRHALLLNIAILLASGVTFGLAISYANDSIRTPVWDGTLLGDEPTYKPELPRPANGKIIVYSTFMPFFTVLQSGADLVLLLLVSIHPLYSLVISSLYFVGEQTFIIFPLQPIPMPPTTDLQATRSPLPEPIRTSLIFDQRRLAHPMDYLDALRDHRHRFRQL